MRQLLLAIITVLLLYGCQDDFEDHNTVPKQSITLKNYTLKEANKIPQFKIANVKAQNELRKASKSNKSSSSRESGDFIAVDSSTVSEISFDDFTSYTMLIEKEEDSQNYFENLVIHVKDEVVTEVFTVKYTPTQAPIYDESSKSYTIVANIETNKAYGITTLYTGNGNDVDPDPSGSGGVLNCIWVMMCNGRNGGGVGLEHRSTQDCQHSYLKRVCDLNMPVRSSCNVASNYDTGNGHGGSGTGSGSNNITTLNPVTVPVVPKTPEELKADIFKYEFYDPLQQNEKDFLTSNNLIYKEIKSYVTASINLNDDGDYISQEVEDFALEVITRVMQNPTLFTSLKPFLIEKQIDDSALTPCQKNVLTAIKSTTVSDIAKVLAKLDANGSVYNTMMKTETLPNGNTSPATTKWNSPYNYTIYISPDYAGKTKLFIASLMFHEVIHAYFLSLFDDYHNANPSNAGSYDDFPFLFDLYVLKKYPASTSAVDIQHQQMAQSYVGALGRALQEYQTGTPVPTGINPDQIYNDLAWGGLNGTPIFDTTFPIGNTDRVRILNRAACEQNGTPIGQGTPNQQNPIGQPCN
ncbi:hypothetical protein [Flavobacterium sp.]|uniref:hypothetical protein n=1 Tax=Flavobacterium sp. TaxID=239 RepID=UPI00286E2F5F|nr:hypothetical protein [Flavobacterium sp.]